MHEQSKSQATPKSETTSALLSPLIYDACTSFFNGSSESPQHFERSLSRTIEG